MNDFIFRLTLRPFQFEIGVRNQEKKLWSRLLNAEIVISTVLVMMAQQKVSCLFGQELREKSEKRKK